eukprot:GHVS01047183.1.p1 GENE.GHVS01047183.1~~GHVS01047183.1.p1  ORF type:complete len:123 (+),score=4.97 GHVS01047183.1:404-772(+)
MGVAGSCPPISDRHWSGRSALLHYNASQWEIQRTTTLPKVEGFDLTSVSRTWLLLKDLDSGFSFVHIWMVLWPSLHRRSQHSIYQCPTSSFSTCQAWLLQKQDEKPQHGMSCNVPDSPWCLQ